MGDDAGSDEEVVEIDDSDEEVVEVDDDNGDDQDLREKVEMWCTRRGKGAWTELGRLIGEPQWNMSSWRTQNPNTISKTNLGRVEQKLREFFGIEEEDDEVDDEGGEVDAAEMDGDDESNEMLSNIATLREMAEAWCEERGYGSWKELARLIGEPPHNISDWKNRKAGKATKQRVEEKMQAFFANDDGANLDDVDEVEVEVEWAAQPHQPNPAETVDSVQQQLEDVRRQLAEEKRRHAADVSRLNQQVQSSADGLQRKQRELDLEREERRKERAAWEEERRAAHDELRECRQELGQRDATQLVVLDGEDEEDEGGSTSQSEEQVESVVDEAEGLQLKRSSKNSTGYAGVSFKTDGRPKPYCVSIDVDGHREWPSFATAVEAAVFFARHVGEQGAPAITHQ